MKAFTRLKIEFLCIDLAYVDKLAKDYNRVKYVLVHQHLFDRIVDAKKIKPKGSTETVRAILAVITKEIDPKLLGWQGNKICWRVLKKNAKPKEYKFTLQWVRPRPHLLNVQYDPWEKNLPLHGRQWIQVLSQVDSMTQFVTTLSSRRQFSIDLIPKNVKSSDFLSILHSEPLREFRKPKFEIGDRVGISKYDLPFRKGYKPQFTKEDFEIVAISSRKPPTYTIQDEEDEAIRRKFYQKETIKVI